MEARADALPRDHRIMYGEIKHHLFRFSTGDGMGTMDVLRDVLALLETGAAQGKPALALTGEDVAAFCDVRLRGVPSNSYVDKGRALLNRHVAKKLGPSGRQG